MFRQYEYPTCRTQSAPPPSSAVVIRVAPVRYGYGNVNLPRPSGKNSCRSLLDQRGRMALPAVSMNPPGIAAAIDLPSPSPPDPHEKRSMAAQGTSNMTATL